MEIRLQELRLAHNMTQRQVAQAVGVQAAAVSKWERGENGIKLAEATKIAELFGCRVDDLMSRDTRELSCESRQHETLERLWGKLNETGHGRLLEYARLLTHEESNVKKKTESA